MKSAPPTATVDPQNPWLGLVSFTEETRGYFHGREEEAAELSRRVQRKLLTVLFGQSGLGKTSILQAGLVPRLRPEGFCPVYVRLDYDPYSPPPAEQIKRALFRETEAAGKWTQSGSAVEGETLWEFLHHRDDVLKDPSGKTLIPILIFDQFEEIFTLAQTDDAGRRRAQEFLADLADLVENRPPAALEGRIDRDETDAARFDFARADYRILISLREDYLAHLEGLKALMPSVTQNRMRLARMTGAQAVSAVLQPAPHLVSEAVAEAVVRFVAGGAEVATAEVEPSLLSLICRELNNTRIAQGHAEISADLLAGSRDTILTEFYERALTDQPHGVRIFIEDEMLTDSGFRESVAEERVRKGFAAAGAAPDTLATLVNRRLLRVEDRLDLRRVEITHDVLCSVIAASRGVRHEREALEESQRQLALQREREAATQKALVRARLVAAVCAVLMLAAAGSAIFGWLNLRRAREAEQKTLAAQRLTEKARSEAEKLVGFLLEDFYEELEPTGRVEIVGELADKAVAYYESLPPELITPQTRLYHGMALIRKAGALSVHDPVASTRVCGEAETLFTALRKEGDLGEATTLGLALALETRNGAAIIGRNLAELEKAVELLRPFVKTGTASRSTRLALADTLQFLALEESSERGIPLCEESRQVLIGAGALELNDLTAASIYGDVCDTESRLYLHVGNLDGAEELAHQVGQIAEKVLSRRPGDLRAMKDRMQSPNVLGMVEEARENLTKAEAYQTKAEEASRNYTLFNPADSYGWQFLSDTSNRIAIIKERQGRLSEAMAQWRKTAELDADPQNVTSSAGNSYDAWRAIARNSAELGRLDDTKDALAHLHVIGENFMKMEGTDESFAQVASVWEDIYQLDILEAKGDYQTIHDRAVSLDQRLQKISPQSSLARNTRIQGLREVRNWIAESALRIGRAEEAVSVSKDLSDHLLVSPFDEKHGMDLEQARARIRYGEALIDTDHTTEAKAPLELALTYFRNRLAKGATDTSFRQAFGRALYQMSRTEGSDEASSARRRALLDEAASVLGGLSQEAQQMKTSRDIIEIVTRARGFAGS